MNQELRKAIEEALFREKMKNYAKNPLLWLEDRLGEDPKSFAWSRWGAEYKEHEWDGTKDALAKVWQELANGNWVGVESSTGTGKTWALARFSLWFLDVFPNSLVVTSAPKKDQLSLNLWKEIRLLFSKFKKLRPYSELLSLRLKADARKEEDGENDDSDWHIIGFVAGVGANEESATKAQGFHREKMLIITEETPGMNRAVMTAFENTSVDPKNNLILAVGNPDNKTDVLHQFCEKEDVVAIRISSYDHPNVVLKRNVIPGAVTQSSINKRKKDYGEGSNFYKSRIRGISPEQSVDALIRLEWLKQAYQCEAVEDDSHPAAGIDVANSELGDKASISWGDKNTLLAIQAFQCPDASHLAYNLILPTEELYQKGYHDYQTHKLWDFGIQEKNVGVDVVGIGASTIHTLQNNDWNAVSLQGGQLKEATPTNDKGEPLYYFSSLRGQMYWEFREDLRKGEINIAIADKLILAQLEGQLLAYNFVLKSGKIAITSKEEVKKKLGHSPDVADSVVYWNWVRKNYYLEDSGIDLPFWA